MNSRSFLPLASLLSLAPFAKAQDEPVSPDLSFPLSPEADAFNPASPEPFLIAPAATEANARGIDYKIRIVPPKPGIDFKILTLAPKPGIDFKIRILDPDTKITFNAFDKKPNLKAPEPPEEQAAP